jgi:hypothetical protein
MPPLTAESGNKPLAKDGIMLREIHRAAAGDSLIQNLKNHSQIRCRTRETIELIVASQCLAANAATSIDKSNTSGTRADSIAVFLTRSTQRQVTDHMGD